MPSLGKLVLFEPWMRHGVRKSLRSNQISIRFFSFPLPVKLLIGSVYLLILKLNILKNFRCALVNKPHKMFRFLVNFFLPLNK